MPCQWATAVKVSSGQGKTSEKIRNFKYNHHPISTSGPWLHANQIDLRIRVMYVTAGEPSEVLGYWLAGCGSLLNRWIEEGELVGVWYNILRLRAIAPKVIFLVLLRQRVKS